MGSNLNRKAWLSKLAKIDNFEAIILRYPVDIQTIVRDLDSRVSKFGSNWRQPVSVQRYTTDIPDIRYRVVRNGVPKPVFLRVRPRRDKVRLEIESVFDPLHKTVPREKMGKWKKSPRSNRERILLGSMSNDDEDLLMKSMLSSMKGANLTE
jgi:hypothetical protein